MLVLSVNVSNIFCVVLFVASTNTSCRYQSVARAIGNRSSSYRSQRTCSCPHQQSDCFRWSLWFKTQIYLIFNSLNVKLTDYFCLDLWMTGLTTEGLYRVPGKHANINKIRQIFDSGLYFSYFHFVFVSVWLLVVISKCWMFGFLFVKFQVKESGFTFQKEPSETQHRP